VALPARLWEICGVDGRARIARAQNVVHAMARSAIGSGQISAFDGKPVIAARVGWQAIRRQIVAQCQAGIAMAPPASFRRDIRGVQRRSRVARIHNQMFAVAVDAYGCISHARLYRFSVDTLVELARDFCVALRAGFRHFPMIHAGTRIAGRVDVVAAVTTAAVRRLLVARSNRAAVNALFVGLDGVRDRDRVPRQKSCIAMAFRAGIRQVLAGNR